ncbi:MAG TPA: ABC transporter ATP-binding protein [Tepidisphaeraceae bacterium]|nr:ABC transporter ATP-binding protein [Tepidisphaeraceae bacterium]
MSADQPTEAPPAIVTCGLGKVLDDRQVLCDINLRVAAGEYIGLLGANGAGKTTLLKILATLMPPSDGQVLLYGQRLSRSNVAVRARIGLIGHQPMLYRDLSARENLTFFARLYSVNDAPARVQRMLRMVGLADRGDDPVKTFSRGMVQRLSIARALLHEPALILADEPFAGLDAPSIQSLEQLLQRLNAAGRTIVMVNHDIEQTLRLAERAIVLRQGRIVLDQQTHRLYAREVLSEVS